MTTTTVEPTADTTTWCAGTAFAAGFTSHLLVPSGWPARKGGGRPTLCGEWRREWRPVIDWADPAKFTPCATCAGAAGIDTPAAHPAVELAPIADPGEIHPAKMASPASSAAKVWHLLHVIRRRRSSVTLAVCGEPRMRWREVDGADHRPCPACAAQLPGGHRAPLVRIAPAAPGGRGRPLDVPTVPASLVDPQLAHAALPAGWRPRVAAAAVYVPRVVEERDYAQQLARAAAPIAFPDWAPLTYCTTP